MLLRLAEKFQIDLGSLSAEEDGRLATDLMEALSDPMFESADVKTTDVRDLAATLPALGQAFVTLYNAYRRGGPSDGALGMGDGEGASASIPSKRFQISSSGTSTISPRWKRRPKASGWITAWRSSRSSRIS